MTWFDLYTELGKSCPDSFEMTHVEAGPIYKWIEGKDVRVSVDYDAIIFKFTGKFGGKYKATVRLWFDSRVTASIETADRQFFEYPVTLEDEHFEQRWKIYGPHVTNDDSSVKSEIKEIYDWTFNAYRSLVK